MRKLVCIIVLIIIHTLLLGYSLDFDFGNVINGGDTQLLLNPRLFIHKSFFVWEDTITGVALPTPGSWLPYASLLDMFNHVLNNISLSSFLFFVTLFSLSSISMFLLSDLILGKIGNFKSSGISFFLSIFYSFNLYTAILFHTPVNHILYLYGITPLLVFLFTKIEVSANLWMKSIWLLLYALLNWPLTRMINIFILYSVLIPLISFIIKYGIKIPTTKFVKYCVLSFIVTCLIALPTLLMFPFVKSMPVSTSYSESAMKLELGNEISDSIRFIRTFAWKCASPETIGGVLSYDFLEKYQSNPFLIFITFYPILIISFFFLFSYPKLQRQDKSRVLGISLLAILNLALTTPSLTLLGELLYQNQIYIFRSAWKYFTIPYILCLSLVLILSLKYFALKLRKKAFTFLLLSLILVHSIYISPAIFIYARPINQAWIVDIPQEYYNLTEFLHKDPENYKILFLPITKHFAGYIPYKWGYVGPDILYTLTDKPIIDKHHNVIALQEYLDLINLIENALPVELPGLCKILNVKYILLRNDVEINHPYIKLNHPPEYYEGFLEKSTAVKAKYTFGDLTLYELKNHTPQIFIKSINIKIDPKNLLKAFNETVYRPENVTCLCFNETPMTIKNWENNTKNIQDFALNITFKLFYKNTTSEDWQIINHVLIQTELFKISVSPKGWLYTFLYFRNGTFLSLPTQFRRMERTSSLEINFQNNTFSMYLDKAKIRHETIDSTELVNTISTIRIGSNLCNTEMLVGNIYDLNFTVNNEEKINTQTLFSNYSDYTKQEKIHKLNLNPTNVKWQKISPTRYHVKISNTTQTQNGYFLTFLTTYDPNWKAYITKEGETSQIPEKQHIKVFDYASAWYINRTGNLEITIEYEPQKWFYYGSIISITTLTACIVYLTYAYMKNKSILQKLKHLLAGNQK